MKEIKVYDIERKYGLEDKIKSQASIAFAAPISKVDPSNIDLSNLSKATAELLDLSLAGIEDPDLYHVFSILVSTSWNKNDDIFDKHEVWAARHTPRFKPTNLEHDEKQMVGGIINSWPVDKDFNLIDDNTSPDDLDDFYHILVSSVIFRQWQDPELKSRAEKLIEEIEAGEKYVSMECIFRGFDYGVVAPDGSNHLVARNEETAFLTKFLRCYGGEGVYQDHRIGRVLRNITFSGKGFVYRPANPDSIVFDNNHIFSFANVKKEGNLFLGVTNNTEQKQLDKVNSTEMEKNIMSDILTEQNKQLKEELDATKAELKEISEKLAKANVSSFEAKIQEKDEAIAELTSRSSELETELVEVNKKVEALEKDLSEKTKSLEEAQAEMDKMKDEKKKKERKDKMVEAGLSDEEAEAKLLVFANSDDEVFNAFVETVAEMYSKKKKDEEEKAKKMKASEEDDEDSEEDVDASDVVDETSESGSHSVASEDEDEHSTASDDLAKWAESMGW